MAIATAPQTRINLPYMRLCLAYNIRQLRKERGITQGDLGRYIGKTQKQVSAIECGRLYVEDVCLLMAIKRRLGCKIKDLYQPVDMIELEWMNEQRKSSGHIYKCVPQPRGIRRLKRKIELCDLPHHQGAIAYLDSTHKPKSKYEVRELMGQMSLLGEGDRT